VPTYVGLCHVGRLQPAEFAIVPCRFPVEFPFVLLLLESLLTLVWMRLLLRFAPGRALRGSLDGAASEIAGSDAGNVVETFKRTARRTPFAHTCLHRSLALQRMLARRGVVTTLRVGIGRKPNLFPGHAWLERDGVVVNDDAEVVARYVPLTISESALEMAYR